ncbi:Uncharacterised protein [uncultured archaeon]|nr:Uncharacterised protein [uncultured archaeon]
MANAAIAPIVMTNAGDDAVRSAEMKDENLKRYSRRGESVVITT